MIRYLKKLHLNAGDSIVVTCSLPCEARLVSDETLLNKGWGDEPVNPHEWLPAHLYVRNSGEWNVIVLTDKTDDKNTRVLHSVVVIQSDTC